MKTKRDVIIAFLAAGGILFGATGCGVLSAAAEPAVAATAAPAYVTYEFAEEDTDDSWDKDGAVSIAMDGKRADISGAGASSSGGTVTISSAGTYVFSGETDDGQILVYAGKNDIVRLVLNGLSITCADGPAIYSMKAGKTVIVLAEGSQNTVRDAASYAQTDEGGEPDAAIFSKDDLTITGTGALAVEASYLDGICSKDVLAITGGVIDVTAADDGIRGTDGVAISDGRITVHASRKGIRSTKYRENDAGELVEGFLLIQGGVIDIPECYEGLEAPRIQIDGGDISITASDDGINAAGGSSGIDDDDFGTDTDDALIPGARPDGAEWGKDQSGSGNAQGVPDDTEGVTPVPGGQGHGGRPSGGQGTGTSPVMPGGQGTDGAPVMPDGQGAGTPPVMPGGQGTDGTSDGQGRAGAGGFGGAGGGFGEMAQTGVFLRVTGGTIDVYGGGDGIDANGDLYIDGGEIKISGPSEAMECAIDLDGTFTITGGKLITAGNAMTPDAASTQNTLRFSYTEQQASGSFIEVKDKSGAALLAYESRIGFSVSAFSSPELKEGETYAIYINEEKLAEVTIVGGTTSVAQDGGSYVTGSGGGRGGAGFGAIPSGAGSPSADGDAAAPPAGGMPFSGEPPASGGADTGIGTEGGEADADAA